MTEPQGRKLFPPPDAVEADRQRDLTTGLLPSQLLREAVAQGWEILSPRPIGDDQIQPASIDGEEATRVAAAAQAFAAGPVSEDCAELALEDEGAEQAIDTDDDATAEAAPALGPADATKCDLCAELAAVDETLALAERHASRPDARVDWLVDWIKANLLAVA
jgi:hypothetical protein